MILGLSLSEFTLLHVLISLLAIFSGWALLVAMLHSRNAGGVTALFLASTAVASASGFLFPSKQIGPGHVIGVLSLVLLVPTALALYRYRLAGVWRWVHVAGTAALLYLNVYIGVRQVFAKEPLLQPFASSQPLVQAVVLALFAVTGWRVLRRFHPASASPPRSLSIR